MLSAAPSVKRSFTIAQSSRFRAISAALSSVTDSVSQHPRSQQVLLGQWPYAEKRRKSASTGLRARPDAWSARGRRLVRSTLLDLHVGAQLDDGWGRQ